MRARDYNTNWIVASAILDEDTYLAAENSYNLFSLAKNSDAAADEERNHLEVCRVSVKCPGNFRVLELSIAYPGKVGEWQRIAPPPPTTSATSWRLPCAYVPRV